MTRLLKKGDQGPEVKELQTLLMEKGFLTGEEINGEFDNETYRRYAPSNRKTCINRVSHWLWTEDKK